MIPLTSVVTRPESYLLVGQVLRSGRFTQGLWTQSLENVVRLVSRTEGATAVNSGSAALLLALMARGVTSGSRVAVPAFTFSATAAAVMMLGARPVFCDVDDNGLLTPDAVGSVGPVDAIVPVHLYGQLCNPQQFDRFGVPVIEDAAQAIGLKVQYGAFSFYGSKTIGAGEGGVIVSDRKTAEWAKVVRNQGMTAPYEYDMLGFNWRMSDITAALAVGQMSGLALAISKRRRNAERLWELLHDLPIRLPDPFAATNWHLFTIQTPNRDEVQEALAQAGVESRVHYPQVLPDLQWFPDADVPTARRLAREVLSIPVHEHLTEGQVEQVAAAVRDAVDRCVVT